MKNTKVCYSLLIILLLNPEALPSFHFLAFRYLYTNSDMKRRENYDRSGSSQGGSSRENVELIGILKIMIENQQKHTKILHQGC